MRKKEKRTPFKKDPHHRREKEKYAKPIPSREYILDILDSFGRPMSKNQLFEALSLVDAEAQEAMGFRLRAMLRDGQLMQDRRNRFCILKKLILERGTIQAHPDGFGFFIPDEGDEDMVLSPKEMKTVMHGDVVLAYQFALDRRGRKEAKIHEVLTHVNQTIVGRYFFEHGVGFVVPDSKRINCDIVIPAEFSFKAKNGQIVLVEMIAFPTKRTQPVAKVIQVLGDHMAPGMETDMAILSYGIPSEFPEPVLKAAKNISQKVSQDEVNGRHDLRHLPFVTIDGEDAQDFDDAVFAEKKAKGGFRLFVAIADVSYYVTPHSELDKEAALRGNSVYFPGRVVPMLPEALSNGICSLNPRVDRLCMVAELTISADGKISRSHFYRAVIYSQARLTYTQVGSWLKTGKIDGEHQALWPALEALHALYRVLLTTRKERGAMDFDSRETRIEFDEMHKIKAVVPVVRNDAHRLIEECMLAANMAVARFIIKSKIPALYRVHAQPDPEKTFALRQFLGEFGLNLGGGKTPTPKDFQQTLKACAIRPEKHLIETVMLRSLKQAQYVESNDGHFGLAYSAYTHFTSPIRRYPDLLIHRVLGHILENKSHENFIYSEENMSQYGRNCSYTERRADEATRDVVAWLKCEYMQDKLGQTFWGRISSVTGFGLFVVLDDIDIEGLIHVTSLHSDYYTFDAVKHRMVGERSGKTYRLGDKVLVLIARVDLQERKIDFDPIIEEGLSYRED